MMIATRDAQSGKDGHLAVLINRGREPRHFSLPEKPWTMLGPSGRGATVRAVIVDARSVQFLFSSQP